MGCTSSKLDDLPAVALCRERCAFLDEAIHQRFAVAEAHRAYLHSLQGVGLSLRCFFDQDQDLHGPVLNLPTQRKGDPQTLDSPNHHDPANIRHSPNSGSHLHFDSDDSDSDDSESHLHHHSGGTSPLHSYFGQINNYADHETLSSYEYPGNGFMDMKNNVTPSVSYQQRLMTADTVHLHMGESSAYYPDPNQNPNSYLNRYPGYGEGINSFFASPSSNPQPPVKPNLDAATPTSKLPPPPPPPSSSSWDFLNLFESFENYYPPYTPSRDSKELMEEGIPDLEDEDLHQEEAVKEIHGEQKFVDGGGIIYCSQGVAEDQDLTENEPAEYDVLHTLDEKVVDDREQGERPIAFRAQGDFDVVREIQAQFERASESGNELAKLLEVGKFPHTKNAASEVSSMIHAIAPSLPVLSSQSPTSKNAESFCIDKADVADLEIDEDLLFKSANLSSTLQKLYLWEKKLYEEVKVEEKMRVLHERKCRKLKRLDERGAEAPKVDATRTLVRSLSTKIRIAIQIVDKISVQINKLRDEELWPQLNEFIQGLTRMWKAMLECHHSHCQAIVQAKRLDAVAARKQFSDAHLEATLQLEHELLSWTFRFSCWVGAQKGFVRALNNWLLKCLLYVPEETPDGTAPFSPGRIGAPPVFIVCNQWQQVLEKISEKEVVDSMRDFATSVLQHWEQDKLEMRSRMMVNKDMEIKAKYLEREDQKIQKKMQALDKRILFVSGDGSSLSVSGHDVYQNDTSKSCSLQVSLQHIFEAMERFTATLLREYEEVVQRIEEDRENRENAKVS